MAVTITTSTSTGLTFSQTISDSDATRLLAWAKSKYGAGLNNQQAHTAMWAAVYQGIRANVLADEKAAASTTAVNAVTDFVLS